MKAREEEGDDARATGTGGMTPARRGGGSPAAPRRLVQLLDVDGEDVPCVNYKKLLREQSGETRASAEKEAKQKSATATASEAAMKSPKSLLESGGAGGGGHMAAVIRRIEALYQGGPGNASSDDEEDYDEDGSEEDSEEDEDDEGDEEGESGEEGEGDDDELGESGDEEDSGSEMEDPDDKPTMTPNGTQRIEQPPAAKSSEEKKGKPAKKKKQAKRKRDVDWYDVDDDFIDDDELDEYFEDDGLKTKHSGFFINKGELQKVDEEGRTPVKHVAMTSDDKPPAKKEKPAPAKMVEWTEETKKTLRKAVTTYGKRWQMILDCGEYPELKSYSTHRMRKQWDAMEKDLQALGIDIVIPKVPPKPPSMMNVKETDDDEEEEEGEEDGLSTPRRSQHAAAVVNSSSQKTKSSNATASRGAANLDVTDPRHPEARKKIVDGKAAEFAKIKALVDKQCETIRESERIKTGVATSESYTFEWTKEIAELMFVTLVRIFFATSKATAGAVWKEVVELWPKDFHMDEQTLRKKHTSVQKKKTAAEKQAIIGLPDDAS